MWKPLVGLCLASALLAGCARNPEDVSTETAKQQILAQEQAWNEAYAKRDSEALAGFFAEDAAMAYPGAQLVRGQDKIRETSAEFANDENLNVSFKANRVEVAESGELAYSRGQYLMTATNPQTNQPESTQGYYLTVWKRQPDGTWKAVEDFVTPGPAMPVAERATMVR